MTEDGTRNERIRSAYLAMSGTSLLCLLLHTFIFWSVYFWMPPLFLLALGVTHLTARRAMYRVPLVLVFVALWTITTLLPLLMIILGKDLLRGVLR